MAKEKVTEPNKESGSAEKEAPKKRKRRNYKKELEQAVAENVELKDRLLRTIAEFDNFRKRVNSEKLELVNKGSENFITSILPILDDLDRFAAVDEENSGFEMLQQGVLMIQKSFLKVLDDHGVSKMETLDQPFDPEKHDALMQIEIEDKEPDIIVEQHLNGYEFKDKVLRHARVVVSK